MTTPETDWHEKTVGGHILTASFLEGGGFLEPWHTFHLNGG